MIVYYAAITFESILKNDNWKLGGHAKTKVTSGRLDSDVRVYGKTKQEAEEKMYKFLGPDAIFYDPNSSFTIVQSNKQPTN